MCYLKLQNAISGLTGILQLASFTSTTYLCTVISPLNQWKVCLLTLYCPLLTSPLDPAATPPSLSWPPLSLVLICSDFDLFCCCWVIFPSSIKGSQNLSVKLNKDFISLAWGIFKDEYDPNKHSRPYVYSLSKDRDRWNLTHSLYCASHKKFWEIH